MVLIVSSFLQNDLLDAPSKSFHWTAITIYNASTLEREEKLEVRDQPTACGRTHRSPQSEGQSPKRLEGQGCHTKQATSPVWEVGLGLHPSSSPTHKGSTIYHVRLSISRSGLCPSDRRLRCVGPLTRSLSTECNKRLLQMSTVSIKDRATYIRSLRQLRQLRSLRPLRLLFLFVVTNIFTTFEIERVVCTLLDQAVLFLGERMRPVPACSLFTRSVGGEGR